MRRKSTRLEKRHGQKQSALPGMMLIAGCLLIAAMYLILYQSDTNGGSQNGQFFTQTGTSLQAHTEADKTDTPADATTTPTEELQGEESRPEASSFQRTQKTDPAKPETDPVIVTFIDVGQGDAILIEDAGETMLIDTGYYGAYDKLVKALTKRGVDGIDALLLTHPDADHIGSAPEILSYYGVERIYMTDYAKDSAAYGYLMDAVKTFGVPVIYPTAGEVLSFGRADYQILGPVDTDSQPYEDTNSYSLVMMLTNGRDTFLFTGDATGEEIRDILDAGWDVQADVYKAAHHGSANCGCNSYDLMEKVSPETVVISCGYGNEYGHPHVETMEYLKQHGIKVYRTDLQGSVSCLSTGDGILWDTLPTDDYRNGNAMR